jgi:hypothetical protein
MGRRVGLTHLTETPVPDSRARTRAREAQIVASVGCVSAPIRTEGVGGLIPHEEAAPQPHLVSCADLFLVWKLLISFPEIKYSNGGPANSAEISMHLGSPPSIFGDLFFRAQLARHFPEKNAAKFPGGGGGAAMTTEGAA